MKGEAATCCMQECGSHRSEEKHVTRGFDGDVDGAWGQVRVILFDFYRLKWWILRLLVK